MTTTTTATTETTPVNVASNVEYRIEEPSNQQTTITPHEPTER